MSVQKFINTKYSNIQNFTHHKDKLINNIYIILYKTFILNQANIHKILSISYFRVTTVQITDKTQDTETYH